MPANILDILMLIRVVLPSELLQFDSQICARRRKLCTNSLLSALIDFGISHIHVQGCGPCLAALQEISTNKVLAVGASTQISPINWVSAERLTIHRLLAKTSCSDLPPGLRLVTTAEINARDFNYLKLIGLVEIVSSCRRTDVQRYTGFATPQLKRNWKRDLSSAGCSSIADVNRKEGLRLLRTYRDRFLK